MKRSLFVVLVLIAVLAFAVAGFAATKAGPDLKGIAYMQTHGGHVAMLDLETGELGRIVHGKGSDALTVSEDGNTIYVFSLDGHAKHIDLKTGKQTEWTKLGNKHCGSNIAPDGTIWVSDMKDGSVYIYDPNTKKLVDVIKVSKSICGVNFSKNGKTAYISDMPGGFISTIDVASRKVTGKIEGVGNFIHRAGVTPDGKELWQTDGNELKGGKPYGVGYADTGTPGGVTIISTKTGKVKDYVTVGGNVHDVDFTPDGKYAIVATRQVPTPDDSAIVVVETKSRRVVKTYSACKGCHAAIGFEVPEEKDAGRPFLCAVDVDWNRMKIPAVAEMAPGSTGGGGAVSH